MSRCFPFPPPGYEKKPRSDHVDLLAKEKHKEKKHKKEKKDREKREGKERKDKERSKDKHKEKKDRKEKRKEKDKERDKDKSRISDDRRTEEQSGSQYEGRLGDSSQKAEEPRSFKFTEELDRKVKDEEKAATNKRAENFSVSIQRSNEGLGAAAAMEKKRVTSNEMVPNSVGAAHKKNDDIGCPVDKFSSPVSRKTEGLGSAAAMQKERGATNEFLSSSTSSRRRGNKGTSQPVESSTHSVQRKPVGPSTAAAVEEERSVRNQVFSVSSGMVQRTKDRRGVPPESLSGSVQRKIDGVGIATAMEKEREKSSEMVGNNNSTEQRRDNGMGRSMEDSDKRTKQKEKAEEREADTRDGEKRKDHDEKKKKRKDKDRHKEKKKEKEKIEEKDKHKHKEHDKPTDSGNKDQMGILHVKPLAAEADNLKSSGTYETIKKRKNNELNGFLHENDVRPNKFPRTTLSSQLPMGNGRTEELSDMATPCSSIKPGTMNNVKTERVLDNKQHKINGIVEFQPSSADLKTPVASDSSESVEVSLRPPHPDSKYLSHIYSVPKMDEWPESDDQEWLFSSDLLRPKPMAKLEADETSQVWADALKIESADVLALPYVIPF